MRGGGSSVGSRTSGDLRIREPEKLFLDLFSRNYRGDDGYAKPIAKDANLPSLVRPVEITLLSNFSQEKDGKGAYPRKNAARAKPPMLIFLLVLVSFVDQNQFNQWRVGVQELNLSLRTTRTLPLTNQKQF